MCYLRAAMRLGKFSPSLTRLTGLLLLSAAMGLGACGKDGTTNTRKASKRLKWVQKPTSGSEMASKMRPTASAIPVKEPERPRTWL